MIEATCAACGTLNRVPEANVPVGAKFITCADCKSRVPIGGAPAPAVAAGKPPALPKAPPIAVPPPAAPTDVIDLADLPAPKRNSALGPLPPPTPGGGAKSPGLAKLPQRSGLAAAIDPELPAPKARPSGPMLDLDDLNPPGPADGGIDLPAPKIAARRAAAVEPGRDSVSDLPAPKATRGVVDLPAPKLAGKRTVADLTATAGARPSPLADLPAPKRGPNIPDMPSPRAIDGPQRHSELPAPGGFFDDLPEHPAAPGGAELPAPKGFFDDLPAPVAGAELPAPKGFFDDLPAPVAGAELPAPKGFFDDLPQAKSRPAQSQPDVADVPAPKGFFEDLPRPAPEHSQGERGVDLPAPKGFFEDIPQVKTNPTRGQPGSSDVPAPKGYFDDIPGRPNTSKPEVPAPKGYFDDVPGRPNTSKPEVPAPKGYFDDVPGRPNRPAGKPGAPSGFFDDLPQPSRSLDPDADASGDLQLQDGPELDLLAPDPGAAPFDQLDLSPSPPTGPAPGAKPGRAETGGARFQEPRGSSELAVARVPSLELELETAPTSAMPKLAKQAPRTLASQAADAEREAAAAPALDGPARARRRKLVLGGVLAAAVLGGGGFVFYQRHAAQVAREARIAEQLQVARASYAASDPAHWQRAARAAREVVELDATNPEALGIGAETLLASALADGTAAASKLAQARAMLDAANSAGIASPQLARARALSVLAAHQPDGAITQLQPLVTAAPKDAALALYLGWALDAKGDVAGAIKAFDAATTAPAVQIPALYGRGTARLELADLEGARADFAAVLELAKDHIGAQVGLAAAEPPSAAEQQETDLLAILARKDIAAADPRAVAQAWTRAGDAAKRAGRYDVARERFKKALAVVPQDLAATTGLADTELRDGKLAVAAELAAAALRVAKDDVPAQLVQSEIEVAEKKLPLASQRLAALAAHPTPLTPLEQARLQLVTGKLREAEGNDDAAVDAYVLGAKAARDLDLAPMMAAVDKLGTMITAADAGKNPTRADELRARSDELLGALADQAEHDPRLALRLGMAYLQGGNADKAEPWLRKAAAARPTDAEARFQLGRALLKAAKNADAIEALTAAMAADPARADIGVALARAYEGMGRDTDAGAMYAKLLAGKDPSIELRGRAGRFYARTGAIDKAGEQGAKIVAADPGNAAGLYLKGEGQLLAGRAADAKQTFQRAVELDRDPQYLDALGRAAEALAQGGDRELQDLALRSYLAASEARPSLENPLAGMGRLYVARHEAAKAITPLLAAAVLDPKNADLMFLIGAAYQELQQAPTALQWLEAAAQSQPNADTFWRIGQLQRDANQGPKAAAALASATRLAGESEKRTGKPIAWLTDALYLRGRVSFDLHDEATARDAWALYVARNPPPSAQLTEVKQLLATSLRR